MFKERLRLLRTQAGMAQRDLALELNVSQQAVGKWETGATEPSIEVILKLSKIFNCTTDFLLGRTDSPELQKKELTIDGQPVEVEIDINRPELQNPSHLEELVRKMIDQALDERTRSRDQ